MKICPRTNCIHDGLPIDNSFFWKDKNGKDGLDGWCIDCRKKDYRDNKPDRKEQKRLYNIAHAEHRRAKAKKWREEYPKKRQAYLDCLKERFARCKKSSAKKRGLIFELTIEQFEEITNQKCYLCGEYTKGKSFCGIDRIDNSIGYIYENCQPCCKMCNYMKLNSYERRTYRKMYFNSQTSKDNFLTS